MLKNINRIPLPLALLVAGLALAGFVSMQVIGAGAPAQPGAALAQSIDETPQPVNYLPMVFSGEWPFFVSLDHIATSDEDGHQSAFLPGASIHYTASGLNIARRDQIAELSWSQSSPCGVTEVFTATLNIANGPWEQEFASTVPDCLGLHHNTVQMVTDQYTTTLTTDFVVLNTSEIILGDQQGFDRCSLPSVSDMQTWWEQSPYFTFNLYLGGISFFCSNDMFDANWLSQVSAQGWTFIPTWVGPQAPCSIYRNRISYEPVVARAQGIYEAGLAVQAARRLGLMGEKVIYYDMEAYGASASTTCKDAVDEFMEGWAQRLHELGYKAGGYGGCTTHMLYWQDNTNPVDDVWVAHWVENGYSSDVTVWGLCQSIYIPDSLEIPDTLWSEHQRLRQYAGDHPATWGDVSMRIDSNVLDGEIVAISSTHTVTTQTVSAALAAPVVLQRSPQVRDMGLFSETGGWVLLDEALLLTADGGSSWTQLRAPQSGAGRTLAVELLDAGHVWLLRQVEKEGALVLQLLSTADGGGSWQAAALPVAEALYDPGVESASLEFIDPLTGWVSLKLNSGSSFSLGRLYATLDGGATWDERSLPVGEPVVFLDENTGFTAGGPAGDGLFSTPDGGSTWMPVSLPGLGGEVRTLVGLPQVAADGTVYVPVTMPEALQPRMQLFASGDGGETWRPADRLSLSAGSGLYEPLPFSLGFSGGWWAAEPPVRRMFNISTSGGSQVGASALTSGTAPRGLLSLQALDSRIAWARTQQGECTGEKLPGDTMPGDNMPGGEPLRCTSQERLLATSDGGQTWREITPWGFEE